MAFKKLIWHFYVAVAFHRLPRSGRILSALHCSNSLRAPSPSPERACTGLARERESVGGARCFLPRGAGATAGRGRPGGGMGGAGAGNDRRAPSRRPGIPPQALRKTRKAVPQPPSPPSALPRRPVIALESCPAGAHLPDGNLTLPAYSLPLAPAC